MSYDRRSILKLMGMAATAIYKPATALAEATKASALAVTPAATIAAKAKRKYFYAGDNASAVYRNALGLLEAEVHGWDREDNDWDGGYVVPVDLVPFKSMSLSVKLMEHRQRKRVDRHQRSVAQIAQEMLRKKLNPRDNEDEDE
jgi:hypothetical protein